MFKRLVGIAVLAGLAWLVISFLRNHFSGDLPPLRSSSLSVVSVPSGEPLVGPLWFWRQIQFAAIGLCWMIPLSIGFFCLKMFVLPFINERERVYADPDTGLFPVIRKRQGPIWHLLRGQTSWYEHDMNLNTHPSRYTHLNGDMVVETHGDNDDHGNRIGIARDVIGVQRMVARSANRGMTVAEGQQQAGVFDLKAKNLELRNRMLEEKAATTPAENDASGPPPLPEVGGVWEALQYTFANPGSVMIGQQKEGGREQAILNFDRDPFIFFGGKSYAGKTTNGVFMAALGALASGYGLVVFEPKTKNDWRRFGRHANYHRVDAANVLAHMRMIYAEYERRTRLMGQHNLTQWHENPQLLPPYLWVFEELGQTRELFKLDTNTGRAKQNIAEFDNILMTLLKAAACTGLRLVAVDQYPNQYHPAVLRSFRAVAYYMGAGGAQIINSHHNPKLRNTRKFDMMEVDGHGPIFYEGWFVPDGLDRILQRLPVPAWPAAFGHPNCDALTMGPVVDEEVEDGYSADDAVYTNEVAAASFDEFALPRGNPGGDMLYDPANPPATIAAGLDVYLKEGRWDEFAKAFFAYFPAARQVDLRKAMSVHGGNSDHDKIKGMGFLMFHCYSPRGNSAHPHALKHLENMDKKLVRDVAVGREGDSVTIERGRRLDEHLSDLEAEFVDPVKSEVVHVR